MSIFLSNFMNRYESTEGISDKQHKEDGETLERFYNRINLDESRRKILDDSKEKNDVCGDKQQHQ
jgi:hypothetical protein